MDSAAGIVAMMRKRFNLSMMGCVIPPDNQRAIVPLKMITILDTLNPRSGVDILSQVKFKAIDEDQYTTNIALIDVDLIEAEIDVNDKGR